MAARPKPCGEADASSCDLPFALHPRPRLRFTSPAGLLARGYRLPRPSRGTDGSSGTSRQLTAYSCGGSRGFGASPHRVPFGSPHGEPTTESTIADACRAANCLHSCIDKSSITTVKCPHRRSLTRERTGNAVRNVGSKSAAAPATVSGEPVPHGHWDNPGKA